MEGSGLVIINTTNDIQVRIKQRVSTPFLLPKTLEKPETIPCQITNPQKVLDCFYLN